MTLRYREQKPSPPLAGVVEAIWTLSDDSIVVSAEPQRIFPDGCCELILNFADPVEQLGLQGEIVPQPRLLLVGQLSGPFLIRPTGRLDLLGVRFRPAGARAFVPEPQWRLTGAGLPLGDLAPLLAARLGAVFDLSTSEARVGLTDQLLAASSGSHSSIIAAAADRVVARRGNVSLDRLIHQTGLGVRQFERRFLDEVGLRPKLLARICRFQGVFQALEAGPGRWAAVAADCGYYDASHLIRDFRELAGDPPSRIVEEAQLLTGVFSRAGRTTDSSNTSG